MVGDALRQVMLRATGMGELAGEGVAVGRASHPICGDEVELSVRVAAARLHDLRWRAAGCPATLAIAALAAETLVGSTVAGAPAALRAAIQSHGGLAAHERHAEGLFLRALAAAVGG